MWFNLNIFVCNIIAFNRFSAVSLNWLQSTLLVNRCLALCFFHFDFNAEKSTLWSYMQSVCLCSTQMKYRMAWEWCEVVRFGRVCSINFFYKCFFFRKFSSIGNERSSKKNTVPFNVSYEINTDGWVYKVLTFTYLTNFSCRIYLASNYSPLSFRFILTHA